MEGRSNTAAPILRLSVEVITAILRQLDDLESLRSAILSCRTLYNVFLGTRDRTAICVLFNQLDYFDIRPEALAAWQASPFDNPKVEQIQEFLDTHLIKRGSFSPASLSPGDVVRIARLHATVRDLATKFAVTCLEKAAAAPGGCTSSKATHAEFSRIQRAFYRFELFSCLFLGRKVDPPNNRMLYTTGFLLRFSPWENEQLACIHDFLFQKIASAFNDIVEHAIEWAPEHIHLAVWVGNHRVQAILLDGLTALRDVVNAETYEDRYKLLEHAVRVPYIPHNLHSSLEKLGDMVARTTDMSVASIHTEDDFKVKVRPPFFEDPDNGPFETWRRANERKMLPWSVYQTEHSRLRQWGYVLWDSQRVEAMRLRAQTITRVPELPPVEFPRAEDPRRWIRKMEIYYAGGRGWWDINDESKVVWTTRNEAYSWARRGHPAGM